MAPLAGEQTPSPGGGGEGRRPSPATARIQHYDAGWFIVFKRPVTVSPAYVFSIHLPTRVTVVRHVIAHAASSPPTLKRHTRGSTSTRPALGRRVPHPGGSPYRMLWGQPRRQGAAERQGCRVVVDAGRGGQMGGGDQKKEKKLKMVPIVKE